MTPARKQRAAGETVAPPLTWPAAELHPQWPDIDPGLAAWRYRRLLAAIQEEEARRRAQCAPPCCRYLRQPRCTWEVLVAVPVAPEWRRTPGQTMIGAYDCVGQLLSGQPTEGTVLAYFPLVPLCRAIRQRLAALRQQAGAAHRPRTATRGGQSGSA